MFPPHFVTSEPDGRRGILNVLSIGYGNAEAIMQFQSAVSLLLLRRRPAS
jgi:hypothetical protein